MEITCTFKEINDSGHWEEFCDSHGINRWCMNEGLADSSTLATITVDEAKQYGMIESEAK